ncbi:MAG: tetratricopeptide repeat protein, partial [Cyanobacteria bacterium]|nr:tetratricopeptide repeat protein [Cyanobacteriota bacterium]
WVPVIFNLLNTGLVVADAAAAKEGKGKSGSGLFDDSLAEIGFKGICRPDNGLMNYSVFLHYLKQEFARQAKHGMPFSVALAIVGSAYNDQEASLMNQAFRAIAKEYDTIAHFQGVESRVFAILLPYRSSASAFLFMKRYLGQARQGAVPLKLHIGSATFPAAASDLDHLLKSALESMERAVQDGLSQCTFDGLEEQQWTNSYNLGKEALREDDYGLALSYFRICEETAERNSKQVVQSLDAIATAFLKQKDHASALQAFEKAMSAREAISEARGLAGTLIQIGNCSYSLGDYDKAEAALLKAARGVSQKQTVCNIYHNVGTMYLSKGRLDDAKTAFKQSLSIMSSELGPSHPAVLQVSQSYSRLMSLPPAEQMREEAAKWRNLPVTDFPLDD